MYLLCVLVQFVLGQAQRKELQEASPMYHNIPLDSSLGLVQ
jgi:hypothetical protein